MNKKNNTGIILLIIAIILIIGGWYFYRILLPEKQSGSTEEMLKEVKVSNIKKLAEENISNFLSTDSFEELYDKKQYKDLNETNTFIDLNTGIGNEDPFRNNIVE